MYAKFAPERRCSHANAINSLVYSQSYDYLQCVGYGLLTLLTSLLSEIPLVRLLLIVDRITDAHPALRARAFTLIQAAFLSTEEVKGFHVVNLGYGLARFRRVMLVVCLRSTDLPRACHPASSHCLPYYDMARRSPSAAFQACGHARPFCARSRSMSREENLPLSSVDCALFQ